MLSCKQVSERASDDIDGRYRGWQKLQIRLHLMICSHCRRFRRHLVHSRDLASSIARQLWRNSDQASATRILRNIEETQDQNDPPQRQE